MDIGFRQGLYAIVFCLLWQKNGLEKCLMELERDTLTRTQSHGLVKRKGASWSLNWPSGANSLAQYAARVYF
jgi:hypothetical protein